jgi:HK97 gp10 family phage protein
MVRISVEIKSNRLRELAARAPKVAAGVIRATVGEIEADARQRVPVDTGALRDSIQGRVINQQAGEVVAGGGAVDYAGYVEEGTVKMPARPYMHPAADAARPRFEAAVARAIAGLG